MDLSGTLPRTFSDTLDVRVTDTCLRDGSHAKRHQFTEANVRDIVAAVDDAGMPVIEVTHGDGLGGSSYNYGKSLVDERILMKAAVEAATNAKIAALMLPGLAPRTTSRPFTTSACRSCGSPHTAPKPTSPNNTSHSPARSVWRRVGS